MPSTRIIHSFYTDGACTGNPGRGGWATVVYFNDGSVFEMGGPDPATTNNRMEMQAAIEALKLFKASRQSDPITLYTDSEYVQKGITQWIKGWKKKNWKNSQGKAVLNQDLWEILDALNSNLVTWKHVRGHSGNEGNERCDAIARSFATGNFPTLQQTFPPNLEASLQENENFSVTGLSDSDRNVTIGYKGVKPNHLTLETTMYESNTGVTEELELPREVRVSQLHNLIDTLRIADEVASKGYLITSSELADLMDVNASAVTSRGDHWNWRNWVVSRVRREGNQILWQLERVD